MTNEEITALADAAADQLQGTCKTIEELGDEKITELFNTSSLFCSILDSQVFLCTQCHWWCESVEMADDLDWVCQECFSE